VHFSHVLHAAIGLLVIEGSLSYRRLQAEFDLNDSQLEALKFELVEVNAWPSIKMAKSLHGRATATRW
jgi:hypothetical protein